MGWTGQRSPGDPQGSLYPSRTRRGFGGTWPIPLPYRGGKRGCDLPLDIHPIIGCFGTPIQAPCALCFSCHSPSPHRAVLPLFVCLSVRQQVGPGQAPGFFLSLLVYAGSLVNPSLVCL